MPHNSERVEPEMKLMRSRQLASRTAETGQTMNDPNPFLPVIYSSTTLLLVAFALAVALI
jgi:hypothetical protein